MTRTGLVLGLSAIVMAGWAQKASIWFQDGAHTLTIWDLRATSGTFPAGGPLTFAGEGTPVLTIEQPESGMTLRGNRVEGQASAAAAEELRELGRPAGSREFYILRSANLTGSAKVILDTLTAYTAQSERAKRENRPVPPAPASNDHTELDTSTFRYEGGALQGTVTVPEPFTMVTHSTGSKSVRKEQQLVPQSFDQLLTVTGRSAVIGIDPRPRIETPLRTGKIQGPVKFDLVRRVKTAGVDEPEITLHGTADEIDVDMTKPEGVLIARGHVHVEGMNGPIEGTANGEILTVTLDADRKPVRAELRGAPTVSTYRDRSSGGGGR